MKWNRPQFVKGPTESIYDDPLMRSKKTIKRRIAEGKAKPKQYVPTNSIAEKERLRAVLAELAATAPKVRVIPPKGIARRKRRRKPKDKDKNAMPNHPYRGQWKDQLTHKKLDQGFERAMLCEPAQPHSRTSPECASRPAEYPRQARQELPPVQHHERDNQGR